MRLGLGRAGLAALAILLAACGATPDPAGPADGTAGAASASPGSSQGTPQVVETAVEPVTLRVGTTYIWDTSNPTVGRYNYALRYLLYDTLVEEVALGHLAPGLAESWEVSDDGLVWVFNLRRGVTFHDGTPLTAEDAAWSLNWAIENQVETLKAYLAPLAEVVALDPTTVQIRLAQPVGDMEFRLAYTWILPRSVWEGMAPEEIARFQDPAAATGSGPYKLVEWMEGESLTLAANEDYWQGPPHIDRVVWQEFATDEAVVKALIAGEIDVAYQVPLAEIQTLAEAKDVELAVMPSMAVAELILNSHKKGSQPPSLNDPAVRLAIAHAIDKQQIVDVAYLGYAGVASTILPTALGDWHNDAVQDVPFDPAEGNRVLDEAGYLDEDGDGIREDPDGNPLEYRLYARNDGAARQTAQIISAGLAQIGITALPTVMDEDLLLGLYPDFDFDLIVWGWTLDSDPGSAMKIFTCDQRAEGGWNDSGYCNADLDAQYTQQAATVDHAARRELIWQMQAKLFEDRPYIMLVYEDTVQAYRSDRFTGFGLEAGDILWKASFLPARPVE